MRAAITAMILLGATGCAEDELRSSIEAAGVFSPGRTTSRPIALFELGQRLFFERELSGNRNIACSSCHMPTHHASDQLPLGRGQGATGLGADRTGGPLLPRNTISPFNRSFIDSLFWDGRVERLDDGTIRAPVTVPERVDTLLEAQALLPLLDRNEMRGQEGDLDVFGAVNELAALPDDAPEAIWDAVMARLMANWVYVEIFTTVFPDTPPGEHDITHVARAIAHFEMRLWELTDTRFDSYLGADHRDPADDALADDQRAGAELFFGDAGCFRCHDGPLLSDGAYHNIGVPHAGPGVRDGRDEGRFGVTGDPIDRFAFRTPPLRNVELTGPYMHNGTSPTLEDAIRQHLTPEIPPTPGPTAPTIDPAIIAEIHATIDSDTVPLRPLGEEEIRALVAFLQSLTSRTEAEIFPGAGEPERVPSDLPVDRATP